MKLSIDNINLNQNFENYIVGPDNGMLNTFFEDYSIDQLKNTSPITIIGESKSGKTHLLNAMHIFYSSIVGEDNIVHTQCTELMNDIMSDITQDTSNVTQYEKAQILLIDDIQLLWGKERLQEAICRLIEKFTAEGKLVVLTLDTAIGLDLAVESFKKLISEGLTVEIKPLTSFYKFKLEKQLEKEKEPVADKIKKFLNDK